MSASLDMDLGSDQWVAKALEEVREEFGSRIASVVHLAAYYEISGDPNPLFHTSRLWPVRRRILQRQEWPGPECDRRLEVRTRETLTRFPVESWPEPVLMRTAHQTHALLV